MGNSFIRAAKVCAPAALSLFVFFAITGRGASPEYQVPTDVSSIPNDKAVVIGDVLFPPQTGADAEFSAYVDVINADNGQTVASSTFVLGSIFKAPERHFSILLPVGRYMVLDAYADGHEISPIRARAIRKLSQALQ